MSAPEPVVELTDTPPAGAREAITGPLLTFTAASLGDPHMRPLVLVVRPEPGAEPSGGLWGRTSWGWLYVEYFFLPESLRRRGLGTALLGRAEAEAVARGCHGAWLETLSDEAAAFYRRQGYAPFGQLADYPHGNMRWFLTKPLAAAPASTP